MWDPLGAPVLWCWEEFRRGGRGVNGLWERAAQKAHKAVHGWQKRAQSCPRKREEGRGEGAAAGVRRGEPESGARTGALPLQPRGRSGRGGPMGTVESNRDDPRAIHTPKYASLSTTPG